MTETKKLTVDDLKAGDAVTFPLPNGTRGTGTLKSVAKPFCTLDDGRKVRPGACTKA